MKFKTFYFEVAVTIPNTTLMAESKAAAVDGDIIKDELIAECMLDELLDPSLLDVEIIECTGVVENE